MTDRVMVFSPTPVLTVTIEQQADAVELHVHPGGQGVWQARMISLLGATATLCVTTGGEVGDIVTKLLADEDINTRAVPRQTGSGWYVHDRRDGERTDIAADPGAPLVRHDLDELYNVALTEGLRSAVSVLGGPAHPDLVDASVYRRLAADLTANGICVVADLSGEHLTAALAGSVGFVKVSHEELIDSGRAKNGDLDEVLAAARQLRDEGADAVLVSRAADPALALLPDGPVLVEPPHLQVVDHRGAGDSMTAGIAAVLARGGTLDEAVKTGAAAGALNVTRHGLGTGQADAIAELIKRVELKPLEEAGS